MFCFFSNVIKNVLKAKRYQFFNSVIFIFSSNVTKYRQIFYIVSFNFLLLKFKFNTFKINAYSSQKEENGIK